MFRNLARLLLFFSLVAGTLLSQTDRATLRGTVQDPSGSVVPGAQVTIQEVGTNIEARKLTTDENGNYEVPALKPGTYRIQVDSGGFRSFQVENVLLDAGQVRRYDVALVVGTTSDTVTVEGGAALIQTENGAISGELDKKKFLDRPMVDVYPSPLSMMTTMGVQGNGWNVVMAGVTDRNKQVWSMDGVANDTTGDQLDNPAFFETVQVNSVGTGSGSSRATGFNMISKRGGNDFHFSGYYKHENSALNAAEFFAKQSTSKKTPYILHEANLDVSGPIIKNRTFFYAAWVRQQIPLGSFVTRTTPTLKMRSGDFSQFSATIKDPYNGNVPFPNQQIPTSRFSSVAQSVMDNYYPKPNTGTADTLTNNYGFVFPYNSDLYKGDWPFIRIDHKLTDKNNLFVRWMRRLTPYIRPGSGFEAALYTQKRDHRQLVASDTHVFSPSLVNIFTFGHQTDNFMYGEEEKGQTPLFGDDVVKKIGLQGVNPSGYHTMGFPNIAVSGGMGVSTLYNQDGALKNQMNDDGANTYSDTLTWNKGKHVITAGGEYRRYWWYSGSVGAGAYGSFTFNGTAAGIGFADFLLGTPYQASRLDPVTNRSSHDRQAGLFVGDTFKATEKLTLDFGVRWDYYGIATYDDGLAYNFDMSNGKVVVPSVALTKVNSLFPSSIPIETGQVIPNADKKKFSPRFSAAYRLTPKTVIRGGYGQYADTWSYTARRSGNTPYQMTETYTQVISTTTGPLFSFPNPFPTGSSATVASQSVTYTPLDTKTGTIRQLNFTVEREVHTLGVRLSYIGMRNTGLAYGTYNMNKPKPSTATFTQSMRPYNLYSSVNVFGTDGKVHYNALQAEVQKRVGDVTFNSNFTWSKNMYNWANVENPYAITDKWARDANNREKYWVSTVTWKIPFGKDRRFMANAPAIAEHVFGGWTTIFVNTLASPTYVSPSFTGSDPSGTSTSGGLPDAVSNPYKGYDRTIDHWFNVAAFSIPTKGNFGNASPYSLEGYGVNVQHLSLAKTFRIGERLKTSFTGSFSNLMNHPNFSSVNSGINSANFGKFTATRPYYEPEKQGYRQVDLKFRFDF